MWSIDGNHANVVSNKEIGEERKKRGMGQEIDRSHDNSDNMGKI